MLTALDAPATEVSELPALLPGAPAAVFSLSRASLVRLAQLAKFDSPTDRHVEEVADLEQRLINAELAEGGTANANENARAIATSGDSPPLHFSVNGKSLVMLTQTGGKLAYAVLESNA